MNKPSLVNIIFLMSLEKIDLGHCARELRAAFRKKNKEKDTEEPSQDLLSKSVKMTFSSFVISVSCLQ